MKFKEVIGVDKKISSDYYGWYSLIANDSGDLRIKDYKKLHKNKNTSVKLILKTSAST